MESKTKRSGKDTVSKTSFRQGKKEVWKKEKIKEYTYCLRCGRRLKNIEARIIGYGAVCQKKVESDHKRKRLFTQQTK